MGNSYHLRWATPTRPLAAVATVVVCLLLAACASTQPLQQQQATGPYPVTDGIKATVVGTPPADHAELPDVAIVERDLAPLVERPVPTVLDYATPLQYTLAAQDGPAPLVFVIAGTGATASSKNCRIIMRALYAAGNHVVCLPSPTSVNFTVGAAPNPVPGYMPADVAALYTLMQAVRRDLAGRIDVTGHALAGYSLGATEAAFLARYDASHGVFDFSKTLLINPAVSLWTSVQRMDNLIKSNLPGGMAGVPAFLSSLLSDLRHPYAGSAADRPVRFNRDVLFRAMLGRKANHRQLAAVVGLTFRLALANMAFAADVLTDSGQIVPAGLQLGIGDSLESYMRRSFDMTFTDYIDQLLLPYWQRDGRNVSHQQLLASADLHSLRDWLAENPRIAVLTNADDPILGADEVTFLRDVFGARAHILPHGGHMGNLQTDVVVGQIERYFMP